jgi:hypothetical protein
MLEHEENIAEKRDVAGKHNETAKRQEVQSSIHRRVVIVHCKETWRPSGSVNIPFCHCCIKNS